jgi:hypothetical protein
LALNNGAIMLAAFKAAAAAGVSNGIVKVISHGSR